MSDLEALNRLAKQLELDLLAMYGSPLLTGENLRRALGFPSIYALRKALTARTVPVPVFTIEHRKGRYALVKDIAHWLATQQSQNRELEEVIND